MEPLVELSSGPIHYRDTGGDGPTVVFVHGILMESAVWQPAVDALGERFRCVRPQLPLGSHLLPMRDRADMSPLGTARLIGEFLRALDLSDVTLVATDTGGAVVQLLMADGCDRVGRVVLTPCDSFENFLPLSIRGLQYLARFPGALWFAMQVMRAGWARKIGFGPLALRPLDSVMTWRWVRPLVNDRRVSRDLERFLAKISNRQTMKASHVLSSYPKEVLLLWPRGAPFFPFSHAERWMNVLPKARLVDVLDSYTLVCQDQPKLLAKEIANFVDEAVPADGGPR